MQKTVVKAAQPAAHKLPAVVFLDRNGLLKSLADIGAAVPLVLDTNVCVQIDKIYRGAANPTSEHTELLLRLALPRSLKTDGTFTIQPIWAATAGLESTQQDIKQDFDAYARWMDRLFGYVYLSYKYRPGLDHRPAYDGALNFMQKRLPWIKEWLTEVFHLLPPTGLRRPDAHIVADAIKLVTWFIRTNERATSFSDTLLTASIFAIAGSTKARHLLKADKARSMGIEHWIRNISWDFLFFIDRAVGVMFSAGPSPVWCTADVELARYLALHAHKEIASPALRRTNPTTVVSTPLWKYFQFPRLAPGTQLYEQIYAGPVLDLHRAIERRLAPQAIDAHPQTSDRKS